MSEDDYTPISCVVYSGYELAIMHRERLRTAWRDPDGQLHQELLTPVDLKTRNGGIADWIEWGLAYKLKVHN